MKSLSCIAFALLLGVGFVPAQDKSAWVNLLEGIPPTKNAARPTGEWNKMLVTVKGNKVVVTLNDEVVNDVPLDAKQIKDRPPTGYIGFQDHGLPLWLRNIKVREL